MVDCFILFGVHQHNYDIIHDSNGQSTTLSKMNDSPQIEYEVINVYKVFTVYGIFAQSGSTKNIIIFLLMSKSRFGICT